NLGYPVRFLARVGLIELTSTKPRRGAVEHYYRAVGRVSVADQAWAQVPDVVKSGMISATLDQAGRVIGAAASSGGFDRSDAVVARREMLLDEQGFAELAAELNGLLERIKEIEKGSAERLEAESDDADAELDAGLVMMLFESGAAQLPMPRD